MVDVVLGASEVEVHAVDPHAESPLLEPLDTAFAIAHEAAEKALRKEHGGIQAGRYRVTISIVPEGGPYPGPNDGRFLEGEFDAAFGYMLGRLFSHGYTPAQVSAKVRNMLRMFAGASEELREKAGGAMTDALVDMLSSERAPKDYRLQLARNWKEKRDSMAEEVGELSLEQRLRLDELVREFEESGEL